jgi:superfamily II DNA/RNA helicase
MEELSTKPACVILNCCAAIGCPQCMITACSFRIIQNDSEGRCPMCRQTVLLSKLTMIDSDLRRGLEVKIDDGDEQDEKDEKDEKDDRRKKQIKIDEYIARKLETPMEPNKQRNKISVLLEIVHGHIPFEAKEIKLDMKSLQKGTDERIRSEGFNKVLCFTDHDSTLQDIQRQLTEEKIQWYFLHGTADNITGTVKKFAGFQGNAILLVNAAKYCAGLNLQFVTHIVYYRKMNCSQIEEQIAGRGQRVGRTCTLEIIYIMYESEIGFEAPAPAPEIIEQEPVEEVEEEPIDDDELNI